MLTRNAPSHKLPLMLTSNVANEGSMTTTKKIGMVVGRIPRDKFKRLRHELIRRDVTMDAVVKAAVDMFLDDPKSFKLTAGKPATPDLFSKEKPE